MERLTLLQQIIGSLSIMATCMIAHVLIAHAKQVIKDLGYGPEPETGSDQGEDEIFLDA